MNTHKLTEQDDVHTNSDDHSNRTNTHRSTVITVKGRKGPEITIGYGGQQNFSQVGGWP